ncbi:esterase [Streptomyces sp. WAC01526]|uniref:esterase n=1 Tax=Streptomyces sp. WAC01526 TaxID=2588709 RepID=UPI0021CCEF99|nr:esterase [Streptomyces sp. WAC01526]
MNYRATACLSAKAIGSAPYLDLSDLARRPMPASVRGAVLCSVPQQPTEPIRAVWDTAQEPEPLRPGAILLSWKPGCGGRVDVTARLGLAATTVVLATWPNLNSDWPLIVHPTLYEVAGLHAALTVATDALRLANHLASS